MSTTLVQPQTPAVAPSVAAPPAAALSDVPSPRLAQFSIEQYHQIVAAGVFGMEQPPRRIEFLEGVFVEMSAVGYRHRQVIDELMYWALGAFPRDAWHASVQQPIQLINSRSVPEPDLAIYRPGGWGGNHPKAEHAGLVIEVADSTLVLDLGYKMRLYAKGGVAEYWVCDVANKTIVVHRAPENGRYGSIESFTGNATVAPLALPTAVVTPEAIFGGSHES
ncbi:hypothetical protein Pla175_04740 [Pirellulimonas nuda]|uniref:Putative restriction endonuclease domain-containing protein n=1 Tax=Pirellulimonas nuda TaxID=2528009 RepID=A0A518D6K7_9BACT|nr:Uma2 family endonuclease [Pirellulimonas nuda]QDU87118.1 hypothetical protein Pla175_04740 [Pirellulimonas nuda]